MVKYLIEETDVEMRKSDYARYGTAYEKIDCEIQTPDRVYEYDTEEEAQKEFDKMSPSFLPDYGGCWGCHYDFCQVLLLKRVERDEDDEFVSEDGIDSKYADRTTACVSDDEDEDEE